MIVAGLIFFLSSRPGGGPGFIRPPFDKVLHFMAFASLATALCFWIRGKRWNAAKIRYALLIISAVAIFGALDEWHQSFVPGRTVSWGDFIADFLGGVFALTVFIKTKAWRWVDQLYFDRHP